MIAQQINTVKPEREVVINPIRGIRLFAGYTLPEFSKILGCSESTLIRIEQGLYSDIPPNVLARLSRFIVSPSTISAEYRRYQTSQRLAVLESRRLNFLILEDPNIWDINPFIYWRESNHWDSRLSFCKDLCLHPSTVMRYEKGLSETMPVSLQEALEVIKVDHERLHREYLIWRKNAGNR